MKKTSFATAAVAALILSGCATVQNTTFGNPEATPAVERTVNARPGKTTDVDYANPCPTGVAKIVQRQSYGQQWLASLSFGFYVPHDEKIYCNVK